MKNPVDPKAIDNMLVDLSTELGRLRRLRTAMIKTERTGAELDRTTARSVALADTLDSLDTLYNNYRWTRYILVPDGHIHFDGCTTLRHDTARTFLPDESGNTVPAMIAKYTTAMCTVCFPEAPVDPAYQEAERKTEADKQAARDERTAKRQAAYDATPKGDDGAPLSVGGDTPKTERGARNALIRRLKDVYWYLEAAKANGTERSESHIQHDMETLAECHVIARSIARMNPGTTAADVYETIRVKAEADTKREYAKAVKAQSR
jgi:hypothetical protein